MRNLQRQTSKLFANHGDKIKLHVTAEMIILFNCKKEGVNGDYLRWILNDTMRGELNFVHAPWRSVIWQIYNRNPLYVPEKREVRVKKKKSEIHRDISVYKMTINVYFTYIQSVMFRNVWISKDHSIFFESSMSLYLYTFGQCIAPSWGGRGYNN